MMDFFIIGGVIVVVFGVIALVDFFFPDKKD